MCIHFELQRREKQYNKKREMYQILSMYDETITHMFIDLVREVTPQKAKKFLSEVDELTKYCNNALAKVASRFNNVTYTIAY